MTRLTVGNVSWFLIINSLRLKKYLISNVWESNEAIHIFNKNPLSPKGSFLGKEGLTLFVIFSLRIKESAGINKPALHNNVIRYILTAFSIGENRVYIYTCVQTEQYQNHNSQFFQIQVSST